MARTHSLPHIVDLTGADDDTEDTFKSLSLGFSRVADAASRMTSQLQAFTSAASNRQDPQEHITGSITPPLPAAVKSSTSLQKDGRPQTLRYSTGRAPSQATTNSSHDGQTTIAKRPSSSIPSRAPTFRPSRAAAKSADRRISETYDILNPLEAQEPKVATPKKPGRPRLDQWTPKSRPNGSLEDLSKALGITKEDAASNGNLSIAAHQPSAQASLESAVAKKRKRSSHGYDSDRSYKSHKGLVVTLKPSERGSRPTRNGKPSAENSDQQIPSHNLQPETNISNNSSRSGSSQAASGPNEVLSTIGKLPSVASDPADSDPFTRVFTTAVYPALTKAERKAQGRLPKAELLSIFRSVSKVLYKTFKCMGKQLRQ